MDLGVDSRACLVTGASAGIGLASTRVLCAEGAQVLMVARDADRLAAAAAGCLPVAEAGGGRVEHLAADVTDPAAAPRCVGSCVERFGRIDVLVNNAGSTALRGLEELSDEEWQRQWELNVMAPLRFMRETAPLMAEQGHGRIVNVSSSAGKRPGLANAAYSVTKSAELSLSRVWADAYASRGVLVNAVAPGPVSSPLWMGDGGLAAQSAAREGVSAQAAVEGMRARIPVGRLGTEEEVADVIAFLCSDRASFVAGSAWSVDGGYVPQFT